MPITPRVGRAANRVTAHGHPAPSLPADEAETYATALHRAPRMIKEEQQSRDRAQQERDA
jgi:hypothetical protein